MEFMGAFLGLTGEQMVRIGGDPFNMTVAALRVSRKSNAVAMLHAETANKMWQHVAGRSEIVGDHQLHPHPDLGRRPDHRCVRGRRAAAAGARRRSSANCSTSSRTAPAPRLRQDRILIGFSRRAAPYKRSDLIFTDRDRIEPYLQSGDLQIVFSGKAHPLDDTGKGIVTQHRGHDAASTRTPWCSSRTTTWRSAGC